MHAKNSEKVPVTTSAEGERSLRDGFNSAEKKETTLMHAKNSEKVPVTTSAEGERSLRDGFTHAKEGDDFNAR